MNNPIKHHYNDLIRIFNTCFETEYNTKLIQGDGEPIYLPANQDQPYHSVAFAHGFFSSALHECAHWFIAGHERRKQEDYGYWYIPDGRSKDEQLLFQQVEVKPQAIEWLLSLAANHSFHFSIDNLSGQDLDTTPFKEAVYQQALWYCEHGLPKRAQQFQHALSAFYSTSILPDLIKDLLCRERWWVV